MDATMTFREMNLNAFSGKRLPHVFFQPRLEPWYDWHKTFGNLPVRYQNLSLLGLLDDLRVSMRYTHYYTEMPYPVVQHISPQVRVHEKITGDEKTITYETPFGELTETSRLTVDKTWREVGFPVKQPGDLKKLRWLIQRIMYSFSEESWEQGSQFVGARGEPQFWLPKSPYQAMALVWMKFEHFIYALADYTAEVEETFKVIDESYDQLYAEIAASRKPRIVNFGENMHEHFLSTKYWERYLIPFYEKRSSQLRKTGIYTHIHIDGYCRSLLKYLKALPFDGARFHRQ